MTTTGSKVDMFAVVSTSDIVVGFESNASVPDGQNENVRARQRNFGGLAGIDLVCLRHSNSVALPLWPVAGLE